MLDGGRRARAPGSSANLGPGFDALALALDCHVEVTVRPSSRPELSCSGEGADLARGEDHLAVRVVRAVAGTDAVAITVASDVPVARGLGSSAALALAAAAAAGAADPLAVALEVEGHPENAAASMLGGLVAAATSGGRVIARRLALDPSLAFVVVVPDRELPTASARAALPAEVPLAAAAANLGRMGLLVAGLAHGGDLVPEAGEDYLHQDRRTPLYPEAPFLLARLRAAGAVVACWSGAGPTLLAVCRDLGAAGAVREAGEEALRDAGLAGAARLLAPDLEGLRAGPL